ncbi:MAG: hypothetical protein KatS3mg105_3901 [Gemmatales bacterium]|nr:MAG: hypothetical protein KatS3mg105_3901 [Gemmatales bacterium]
MSSTSSPIEGRAPIAPKVLWLPIDRAIEVGATVVEIDVRSTKDGQLVCLHDATVDRTTNGRGKVADFTLAEIKMLDAGSWFDLDYKQERIPMMREVLALCRGKCLVLLEPEGDRFRL